MEIWANWNGQGAPVTKPARPLYRRFPRAYNAPYVARANLASNYGAGGLTPDAGNLRLP
jgi:hypothetical protein